MFPFAPEVGGGNAGHRTAATGGLAPARGLLPQGCAPHWRRHKVRSTPFPPAAKTTFTPFAPPFPTRPASLGSRRDPVLSCRKENGPWTVQKKRTLRRVGPRKRIPPAAGGGRLALPRGSQGRKRVPLGDDVCPGKSRIPLRSLSAGAGLGEMERRTHLRPPLRFILDEILNPAL